MKTKRRLTKKCAHCGERMERKRYNGRLEDYSAYRRRKYCSKACSGMANRKANPGKSALHKRAQAFKAQSCEECNSTMNLHVHHLDNNPANNTRSNTMTLCGSCHLRWHWKHGKTQPASPPCKICGRPSRKLAMCQLHYQRLKKYGDPLLTKIRRGQSYELVRVDSEHCGRTPPQLLTGA